VLGLQRAIHDQDVAVVQTGALHRIASQPHEIGGGGMLDQQFVEIEVAVQVVVGGRGEAGRRRRQEQQARER